jgi:benzoate-CoA ligase
MGEGMERMGSVTSTAREPAPLVIPPMFNLTTALVDDRLASGDEARVAIETPSRTWTYGEVYELVNRAGNALLALGVMREQRVLICLPDSVEFIAALLGAIRIGAVGVPCSTFLGSADYAYFLRETRAAVLVTTRELLGRMTTAAAEARDLRSIVIVGPAAQDPRARDWGALVDSASPESPAAETHRDEAALWLWTSGSTGEPKAAVHLHQDALWCCHLFGQGVLGIGRNDRVFSAAKLFHAYGLGNALFFPFWTGATAILVPDRALPDLVFTVIDSRKPTVFFGVPTLYALMLQIDDAAERFDLSSLRFCVSAGEPLPAEIYHRWHARFHLEILDGIGSTELLNMYICSRPGRIKAGSSGEIVPGYSVRIVDEQGDEVATNQTGDLLVKGPSASVMYWNRRDQTKQKMRGEWFVSGDKYRVDEDGYFWYAGRADDMFKVSGEWVSPTEVEATLVTHDAVVECAVVPYAEALGVLKPRAFVVLRAGVEGSRTLIEELQAVVRSRLAAYKCPREIAFLPELPKTATGKIQRFKLRSI